MDALSYQPTDLSFEELEDTLLRIERLNRLIRLHEAQPQPDALALDGYQRLKQQYAEQLAEILTGFQLELDVVLKRAA